MHTRTVGRSDRLTARVGTGANSLSRIVSDCARPSEPVSSLETSSFDVPLFDVKGNRKIRGVSVIKGRK